MMRGFTLVEVIVALVLVEIGILGAVGTLVLASRNLAEAERLERAVLTAERVGDSLLTFRVTTPGRADFAGGEVVWAPLPAEPPAVSATRLLALDLTGDTLIDVLVEPRP